MIDFLKSLFGTKSEKDVKNLQSKVDEINTLYNSLKSVSNDELRVKSRVLRDTIQSAVKVHNDKISAIKLRIETETEMDVDTKEELYKEIDEVDKEVVA